MAAMLAGAALAYVIPWHFVGLPKELNLVIPVMVVAVLMLNAFVQNYDRIIDWYKTRALGFALDHGLFVVFVCAVLVINAMTLVAGGGMATVVVDALTRRLLELTVADLGEPCAEFAWLALGSQVFGASTLPVSSRSCWRTRVASPRSTSAISRSVRRCTTNMR